MTHSMTAFARVQHQLGCNSFCWELKSVNHRYFDVSFRLPEAFRFMEVHLRTVLRGQVNRGKLECFLKIDEAMDGYRSIEINEGLVKALLEASLTLASHYQLADDLTVSHMLQWPGVVEFRQGSLTALSKTIEHTFQEALSQLLAERLKEGELLKAHILVRLDLLNNEILQAKKEVASIYDVTRSKLLLRLQNIQIAVPEARIEQEIALILARLDVSEELDRLQIHLNEVARTLACDEVAGRRLDFLMQELTREANTLGSKSDSVALTQHAVQMKVLIEQMREQIQNIE